MPWIYEAVKCYLCVPTWVDGANDLLYMYILIGGGVKSFFPEVVQKNPPL